MDYWIQRNLKSQQSIQQKTEKQISKQLVKYYQQTMESVISQFEATYDKLLANMKDGQQPTPADLYKLDKYWQMQGQLAAELEKLGDKQASLLSTQFTNEYLDVYEKLAIPGQEAFTTIDTQTARQMINQVWVADGKTWSQRIWTNTNALKDVLNEELVKCVVSGKKTSDLKKLLQERFGVTYRQAETIVRTETSHIQTQAAQQRYKDYGIAEVEVFADEDERRCEVCGKLHQKRFPIGGAMPVPVHPNCRCTILPVI